MKMKVAVAVSAVVALVATALVSTPAAADSSVEYIILVQAAPDRTELPAQS
jgi:phage head maturation protease